MLGKQSVLGSISSLGEGLSSDVRRTTQFFYTMVAAGFFVIALHSWSLKSEGTISSLQAAGTSFVWALASLASGAAVGFLFGIPKILQLQGAPSGPGTEKTSDDALHYQQQVNTNLTEISDWLTKIIVGLGLINLKAVPSSLVRLADILALSIAPMSVGRERPFALGVLIFFVILGFLFGYLSTRLFLAGAFWRADTNVIASTQASISVQLASLQTSQGVLSASVASQSVGQEKGIDDGDHSQSKGADYLLKMADEYMNITASSWGERVRLKDEAAARMGDYVIKAGISRDQIADQAKSLSSEGLVLALATVVNFAPKQGDLELLLKVWNIAKRKHVQFRVVLALGRLIQSGMVPGEDRSALTGIFDEYAKSADSSLANLIVATRLSMESSPALRR